MKRYNSLNEEINRMMSLFTEERIFGNLIKEQTATNEVPTKQRGENPQEKTPVEKQTTSGVFTEKECIDFVRDSHQRVKESGDVSGWTLENPKGKEKLIWCYSNHNKKLTQDGLFGPGNKTNELFSILKLELPEVVDGGEEQKWYNKIIDSFDIKKAVPVRRDGEAIILYIKNIDGNKYRFKSEKGMNLFDVINSKGKNKYLKKDTINLIKKELKLGDDSKITVINGINTRGFDVGTFIIS